MKYEQQIIDVLKKNGGWMSAVEIEDAIGITDEDEQDLCGDEIARMAKAPSKIRIGLNSGSNVLRPDKGAGTFYAL